MKTQEILEALNRRRHLGMDWEWERHSDLFRGVGDIPMSKLTQAEAVDIASRITQGELIPQDVISHRTTPRFSFLDRIKILFGARVQTRSEIACEFSPGITRSEAVTEVWFSPLFRRKQTGGMVEGVHPIVAKEIEESEYLNSLERTPER